MTCHHKEGVCCVKCMPQLWRPGPEKARAYMEWRLTRTYLEAKQKYYLTGTSPLTDLEFDALEKTLVNVFGFKKPVGTADEEYEAHLQIPNPKL